MKQQQAIINAADKWVPAKHPRGRDGKFIETGAFVQVFSGPGGPQIAAGKVTASYYGPDGRIHIGIDVGDGEVNWFRPKQIQTVDLKAHLAVPEPKDADGSVLPDEPLPGIELQSAKLEWDDVPVFDPDYTPNEALMELYGWDPQVLNFAAWMEPSTDADIYADKAGEHIYAMDPNSGTVAVYDIGNPEWVSTGEASLVEGKVLLQSGYYGKPQPQMQDNYALPWDHPDDWHQWMGQVGASPTAKVYISGNDPNRVLVNDGIEARIYKNGHFAFAVSQDVASKMAYDEVFDGAAAPKPAAPPDIPGYYGGAPQIQQWLADLGYDPTVTKLYSAGGDGESDYAWISKNGSSSSLKYSVKTGKPTEEVAAPWWVEQNYGGNAMWTGEGWYDPPVPEFAVSPPLDPAPAPEPVPYFGPQIGIPENFPLGPYMRFYKHPQGSTIVVDGGVVTKYNPAGKKVATSATAEKLLSGHGGWKQSGFTDPNGTVYIYHDDGEYEQAAWSPDVGAWIPQTDAEEAPEDWVDSLMPPAPTTVKHPMPGDQAWAEWLMLAGYPIPDNVQAAVDYSTDKIWVIEGNDLYAYAHDITGAKVPGAIHVNEYVDKIGDGDWTAVWDADFNQSEVAPPIAPGVPVLSTKAAPKPGQSGKYWLHTPGDGEPVAYAQGTDGVIYRWLADSEFWTSTNLDSGYMDASTDIVPAEYSFNDEAVVSVEKLPPPTPTPAAPVGVAPVKIPKGQTPKSMLTMIAVSFANKNPNDQAAVGTFAVQLDNAIEHSPSYDAALKQLNQLMTQAKLGGKQRSRYKALLQMHFGVTPAPGSSEKSAVIGDPGKWRPIGPGSMGKDVLGLDAGMHLVQSGGTSAGTAKANIQENLVRRIEGRVTTQQFLDAVLKSEADSNSTTINMAKKVQEVMAGKKVDGYFSRYDGNWTWQSGTYSGGNANTMAVTKANAERALRETVVNGLIQTWASTSNDSNPRSLAVQHAAEIEFGLKDTHGWSKAVAASKKEYTQNGALYREFLRVMYENTQEWAKANGITKVRLRRGSNNVPANVPKGATHVAQYRPLSSFSSAQQTAAGFGSGYVVDADVPIEWIIGNAATGFGCRSEYEWVILGGKHKVRRHS